MTEQEQYTHSTPAVYAQYISTHSAKKGGVTIHRGGGKRSPATYGGWRPCGGRPGRALASQWAGLTTPGGTAAQRARCADLGGAASALARRAPRGPVGVGADRGPGAMLSRRTGAARCSECEGPGLCCCARLERPADRCATGTRASCPTPRRFRAPEERGESGRRLVLRCVRLCLSPARAPCLPPFAVCDQREMRGYGRHRSRCCVSVARAPAPRPQLPQLRPGTGVCCA
eukprot:scaffold3344_cov138-Isochrysis_galbana.AAC.3